MIERILEAFILGVLTPLTAVCVLPLYPGFLSYLASQLHVDSDRKQILKFGLLVALGVISFMFLLGLVFTTLFEVSLTNVIGIVSPIAFGVLIIISLFLIFDLDFSRFLPHIQAPSSSKNPYRNAFLYGFFFGGIIVPCNPGFLALFFARSTLSSSFVENLLGFLAFGVGIAAPLLLLSVLSLTKSREIISVLVKYKKVINLVAGLIMLGISLYYLLFVFRILG